MRSTLALHALHAPSFAGGVAVGLGAAAVAIWTVQARRRARARAMEREHVRVIDGTAPESEVALALRPQEEASTAPPGRLESEIIEPAPESQRW